jgi:predicted DNA-binding transcriptional regulator YafY
MATRQRTPTYGAATRLARILHELHARRYGWSFQGIQDTLGISERTLLRYLAVCRRELVNGKGQPLLEVIRRGSRRLLRLSDAVAPGEASSYELLFLYFALSVFQFLDGTVIKDGVAGLWDRLWRGLPLSQQARLGDFARKFYAVPYAVKDYHAFDEILDTCIQCLVYQHRMRIDYRGLRGEGKIHEFDPYTLTTYRGGLYLIGYSHLFKKIIWLAVERMGGVEKLPTTFEYPKTYSPQKHTAGIFGIIDGPETQVELLLRNADTAAYLSSRRLHPTQQFTSRRDGTTLLTMTVRGTTELLPWILGLGPYVEVLKPRALREQVQESLTNAIVLYVGETEPTRRKPPHATRRQVRPLVTRRADSGT